MASRYSTTGLNSTSCCYWPVRGKTNWEQKEEERGEQRVQNSVSSEGTLRVTVTATEFSGS